MGKPKMLGMAQRYIQNDRADLRYRKKFYQRGKDCADNAEERKAERAEKLYRKEKYRMEVDNG